MFDECDWWSERLQTVTNTEFLMSVSHSTWGIWIQILPTMIQRLELWERVHTPTLAWTLTSKLLVQYFLCFLISKKFSIAYTDLISVTVSFDRVGYAGDNFARYSGDTITMAQTQRKSIWYGCISPPSTFNLSCGNQIVLILQIKCF